MLAHVRPPMDSDNGNILQQNSIRLDRRNPPARETDYQQPAFRRNAFCRQIENVAAHRVVDHVRSVSVGKLLNPIHPTRIAIIDGMLRALRATEIELGLASRSR